MNHVLKNQNKYKKIHDEQIIKNVNKDRLSFVCFMTLHYCAMGTVVSNEPEVARWLGSPLPCGFMRVDNGV